MKDIEYRYELKFVINRHTAELLKQQLKCLMYLDEHSVSEEYSYQIRSLYFDDPYFTAYSDKVNGEEYRSKYRMRMYNFDDSMIRLECKYKEENMTYKDSCKVSRDVAKGIIDGRYTAIRTNNRFLNVFLAEALAKRLKPSVIVDYRRLALTYPVSEVRITFDEDLRSGRYSHDFFNSDLDTVPLFPEGQLVLEVKCNEYIPAHILAVLSSVPALRQAVSKFALCSSIK